MLGSLAILHWLPPQRSTVAADVDWLFYRQEVPSLFRPCTPVLLHHLLLARGSGRGVVPRIDTDGEHAELLP